MFLNEIDTRRREDTSQVSLPESPPAGPAPTELRDRPNRPPVPTRFRSIKRVLVGTPLSTERLVHERLGKPTALAVFASDNLSSSAYATEEILNVLVKAAAIGIFAMVVPITLALLAVLGILLFSYRQTIKAYPQAGGAYLVTRDNFGLLPAQIAGVALLTDYILTVAVSVAAGTAALVSVFGELTPWRVPISLAFIALIAFGNLRGVRESGRIFAVPTYFFLFNIGFLLVVGLSRTLFGHLPPLPPHARGRPTWKRCVAMRCLPTASGRRALCDHPGPARVLEHHRLSTAFLSAGTFSVSAGTTERM